MNPNPNTPTVQIQSLLDDLEHQHHARVLFAVESGSRAWGFASPDSDYDVRFVYVHRREWYLSVEDRRDVIEVCRGDLDVSGWELRKALRLLRKSNPSLIEWLNSPLVYRQDVRFISDLRDLAAQCLSVERCFQHYFHLARGHWQKYLQGDRVRLKKYLYVLRPLLACRWLEQGRGAVPVPFSQLLAATLPETNVRAAVEHLLERKRLASEAESAAPDPVLHRFITSELARLQPLAAGMTDAPETDLEALDQFFQTVALAA